MTRPLLTILSLLAAGSAFGQTVLLNTRLHPSETLTVEQTTLQLDLQDFFQTYPAPGPVATLTIRKPVQEGWRTFTVDGAEIESMSYKLASGELYDDPTSISPSAFEWTEHTVEYQLFGDEAPVTVANFKTYADDGAYANTIIHRNESTGRAFLGGQVEVFQGPPILQSGGFRIYETDQYLLEWVPTRPPIVFEQTRNNVQGTIAMARTNILDSATSQFFINLEDNSRGFGSAYSVFGELIDPENDQPVLDDFARTDVYNLTDPKSTPQGVQTPNIFPTLPFTRYPLYSPFWDDKSSYVRFTSITVPDGDPAGLTYSWAFVDTDGEEGTSEEEAANQASFDIQIDGSQLAINRLDTAFAVVEVTGSNGAGETASFQVRLIAFNPDALDRFPGAAIRQGGNLESDWFGTFYADTFPRIVHPNHGEQYVEVYTPVGGNTKISMYYDYKLASYLYTTPGIYPRIYVYSLGKWVQYAEGTGNGGDVPRWFYRFDADNAGWVSEDDL